MQKNSVIALLPRLGRNIRGLAQDFWKDGPKNPLLFKFKSEHKHKDTVPAPGVKTGGAAVQKNGKSVSDKLWHAAPAEISEKMWGEGFVTPGTNYITDLLVKPLGITKDMNILDLSAGLGGRIRKISHETGAYVTGLEPDTGIAQRGMEMSKQMGRSKHAPVEHYNPESLTFTRAYDCVIAQETFYRISDKDAFFKIIADGLKQRGNLVFTDYIVDPENRDKPAIIAWQAVESSASPLGFVETAERWAKVGVNIRISEDLSDFYKNEVAKGLIRLQEFLASGIKPDSETKQALQKRIKTWAHRMSAMEQGMKFYRFYGAKR